MVPSIFAHYQQRRQSISQDTHRTKKLNDICFQQHRKQMRQETCVTSMGSYRNQNRVTKRNTIMKLLVLHLLASSFKNKYRASLVAQWLRIRLPMQGIRVRALVWEDPTCRGAAGPMSHNY